MSPGYKGGVSTPDLSVRPGDLALTRGRGPIAALIRFGTRSRFAHARLVVSGLGDVVEAQPHGARRWHIQHGDVVVRVPLTDTQRRNIAPIAATLVGTPYGFLDVAALGLAQFGITLPSVRRRLARRDRLFCSQLVDTVWQAVGFHAFTDSRPPQDVSPGDLADLAFADGWPSTTY